MEIKSLNKSGRIYTPDQIRSAYLGLTDSISNPKFLRWKIYIWTGCFIMKSSLRNHYKSGRIYTPDQIRFAYLGLTDEISNLIS